MLEKLVNCRTNKMVHAMVLSLNGDHSVWKGGKLDVFGDVYGNNTKNRSPFCKMADATTN